MDATLYTVALTRAEWPAFWADNREALEGDGFTEYDALNRALRGDLLIGGGAAPLFIVTVERSAADEINGIRADLREITEA